MNIRNLIGTLALTLNVCLAQAQQKTFTIAVLPDTQMYTEEEGERNRTLFESQTRWIVDNYRKENIVYVVHVGDIVNRGDDRPEQWENAFRALSILEQPLPGKPEGIPYGLAVGNHEQTPSQWAVTGKTEWFNHYFGVGHFEGRSYYGGHYGNDNDSHYDLFSAGGMDFIAIYIEYDAMDENIDALNDWAVNLCKQYPSRKAIIVSHGIIHYNPVEGTNANAPWLKQGERIYDRLKTCPNVFMMLCGHVGDNGEGYREDGYAGRTIKTFLSDYQSRPLGGGSLMRLMTFDPENDLIKVRTIAPYLDTEETDADSKFVKPWKYETTAARIYDFDNDGKSEFALFKGGIWQIGTEKQNRLLGYGKAVAVPADYHADGKAALAVYRPQTSEFCIEGKGVIQWGQAGDIPVPADYNGDGLIELATWRPADQTWHIQGQKPFRHGTKKSIPVPADYDGDGRVEPAVYRTDNHTFYISEIANLPLGQAGDIPVPADYNGDGKIEIAVYRSVSGEWIIDRQDTVVLGGTPGDIPVPGAYEEAGKVRPAVYNMQTGLLRLESGKKLQMGKGTVEQVVNLPFPIRQYILDSRK